MGDLVGLWPVVIVQARYSGVYERGKWLAAPAGVDLSKTDAHSEDLDCMDFFDGTRDMIVGRGATPNDALANLVARTENVERSELDELVSLLLTEVDGAS